MHTLTLWRTVEQSYQLLSKEQCFTQTDVTTLSRSVDKEAN